MKIYIGSDHAGFEAKKELRTFFEKSEIRFEDVGPYQYNEEDDYPEYAFKVGEKVAHDKTAMGILICGSGVGVTVAANKVRGIRAVAGVNIQTVKMSRIDGNANVLGLSARNMSVNEMKKVILAWLKTDFSGEKRHQRRVDQIAAYERKNE